MKYILSDRTPEKGDIIKVIESVYTDQIITKQWQQHFINRACFYKVLSITNNGSITAKDKAGKTIFHLYAADKFRPIKAIYKAI